MDCVQSDKWGARWKWLPHLHVELGWQFISGQTADNGRVPSDPAFTPAALAPSLSQGTSVMQQSYLSEVKELSQQEGEEALFHFISFIVSLHCNKVTHGVFSKSHHSWNVLSRVFLLIKYVGEKIIFVHIDLFHSFLWFLRSSESITHFKIWWNLETLLPEKCA
jgi:hypothetical protein